MCPEVRYNEDRELTVEFGSVQVTGALDKSSGGVLGAELVWMKG